MAANTLRPTDSPRRANVPRPVTASVPEELPAVPVAEKAVPEPAPTPVREQPRREPQPEARPRSSWSIFSLLDRITSVDRLFRDGLPVRYLPKLLFVMLLTLVYIGNTHYGNRMSRNIQRLKQETEDLRADYTTLKSDYMEASKQSEVARKVAAIGLVESSSPPFRITVPTGHLDAAELELMPVLTADTLAARAARDSTAAQLADLRAGRRRRAPENDVDSGPEIIAPPQALEGDSVGPPPAQVVRAMPVHRPGPQGPAHQANKAVKPARAAHQRAALRTKAGKKAPPPKGAGAHQPKTPAKPPVKTHSR